MTHIDNRICAECGGLIDNGQHTIFGGSIFGGSIFGHGFRESGRRAPICVECGQPLVVGNGPDHVFCDICGRAEHPADLTPDWDGETGNHLSCEGRLDPPGAYTSEPMGDAYEDDMSADDFHDLGLCPDCDADLTRPGNHHATDCPLARRFA